MGAKPGVSRAQQGFQDRWQTRARKDMCEELVCGNRAGERVHSGDMLMDLGYDDR
jgi:hypothetical protein